MMCIILCEGPCASLLRWVTWVLKFIVVKEASEILDVGAATGLGVLMIRNHTSCVRSDILP